MNLVVEEIKTKLETVLGAGDTPRIKKFFNGRVKLVPSSYMPALMVYGARTNVIAKSTAKDQFRFTLVVRVVVNLASYFSEEGVDETIKSQEDLRNIMEERNADGSLKANTVLGILRDKDNVRGVNYLYNNDITIEYEIDERGKFPVAVAELRMEATTNLTLRPT